MSATEIHKGDLFYSKTMAATIHVRRVSTKGEWADIFVMTNYGHTWTKRQPLVDGRFGFQAEQL